MKASKVDYSTPSTVIESGVKARKAGLKKSDCPIDWRTNANARVWWMDGWDYEDARRCKGINCNARQGIDHSSECIEEHERAYRSIRNEDK